MSIDPAEAYRRARRGLPITDTPINGKPDPIADNDAIWGKLRSKKQKERDAAEAKASRRRTSKATDSEPGHHPDEDQTT